MSLVAFWVVVGGYMLAWLLFAAAVSTRSDIELRKRVGFIIGGFFALPLFAPAYLICTEPEPPLVFSPFDAAK